MGVFWYNLFMEWFIYAFLAPVLWALVNIADKFLVDDNSGADYPIGSLVIFSSIAGLVVMAVTPFLTGGIFEIGFSDRLILVASGVINLLWIILYLHALESDEVSSVTPWFLTIPVFAYILGHFILGETITGIQIFGGAIILFGNLIFSIDFKDKDNYKIKWKTVALMVPASILGALWGILFKFVAQDAGFWESSFWEYAGLFLAGLFIFIFIKKYRNGFLSMLRNGGKKILTINFSSEFVTIIGNLLNNFALLLAPVTLVYLVAAFQPVFVLIFAIILTIFIPKILQEDISKRTLFPKVIALVIMVIGSYLLL